MYWIYINLIEKFKVKVDLRFFIAALPFVVTGSLVRALVDHNIIRYGFWTVTPGIYLLLAAFFAVAFRTGHYIEKRFSIPPWKFTLGIGSIPVLAIVIRFLNTIYFHRAFAAILIPILVASIALIVNYLAKNFTWNWVYFKKARLAFLSVVTHSLDACSTFVFHDFYGGGEQHPIPRALIEYTGTGVSFILLKIAVLLFILYILKKEVKDKNLRNFFITIIALLGLAQGLRNYLTIILT